MFRFPQIGALTLEEGRIAILKPVLEEKATIDDMAVREILKTSERYPYFIQQWAHDTWNEASGSHITRKDVVRANRTSIRALDSCFFRVRFDRCTPAERRYMRALAGFGAGLHRSGEVAAVLGVKTQDVGMARSSLIRKGMIYAPQHGDTAFTVPLFDAYMRRVMPELD